MDCSVRSIVSAILIAGALAQAQHADDIWVGRSASGQLKIDTICSPSCGFNPDERVAVLLPDELGGHSLDEPGFDGIAADEPADDIHMLAPGAQIRLQIVAGDSPPTLPGLLIDPALFIYDPVVFTFYPYQEGSTLYREVSLGNYQLHKHVLWFIDPLDPGFDALRCAWEVTVRLIDTGSTGYAPSEPFTLRFSLHALVPGDFDCDQDVDTADVEFFTGCASGPAIGLAAGCEEADLDGDLDADSADFATVQRCLSGQNVVGNPACAGGS